MKTVECFHKWDAVWCRERALGVSVSAGSQPDARLEQRNLGVGGLRLRPPGESGMGFILNPLNTLSLPQERDYDRPPLADRDPCRG